MSERSALALDVAYGGELVDHPCPWPRSLNRIGVEGVEAREHDGSRVIRVGLSWGRTPRTPRAGSARIPNHARRRRPGTASRDPAPSTVEAPEARNTPARPPRPAHTRRLSGPGGISARMANPCRSGGSYRRAGRAWPAGRRRRSAWPGRDGLPGRSRRPAHRGAPRSRWPPPRGGRAGRDIEGRQGGP